MRNVAAMVGRSEDDDLEEQDYILIEFAQEGLRTAERRACKQHFVSKKCTPRSQIYHLCTTPHTCHQHLASNFLPPNGAQQGS
jgi:hypothetical protein